MGGRKQRRQDDAEAMYRARPQLERLAEELFAFLVTDRGFARGPTESEWWATTYYYTRGPLALEVNLDFRDQAVDLALLRLQADGRVPPYGGHSATADGQRQRVSIPLFLRDRAGVQGDEALDALFTLYRTAYPRDEVNATRLLEASRAVVARHLDLLLRQPLETLFPRGGESSQLPGRDLFPGRGKAGPKA